MLQAHEISVVDAHDRAAKAAEEGAFVHDRADAVSPAPTNRRFSGRRKTSTGPDAAGVCNGRAWPQSTATPPSTIAGTTLDRPMNAATSGVAGRR